MRTTVVNSRAFDLVLHAICASIGNSSGVDAAAHRRAQRLASVIAAIGRVASRDVDVLRAEPASLLPLVRPLVPAATEEDVALCRDAMAVAAAGEKGDENALYQVGRAWLMPLVPQDGALNESAAALRLASAAHEQGESSDADPCCMQCGLDAPEPAASPPDPRVTLPPPRGCADGICAVPRV